MFVFFYCRSFFGKKSSNEKKPDKPLHTPPSKKAKADTTRDNEDSPIAKKKKRKMVLDSDDEEEKDDVMKENQPRQPGIVVAEPESNGDTGTIDITDVTPAPTSIPTNDVTKTPPKRVTGQSLIMAMVSG